MTGKRPTEHLAILVLREPASSTAENFVGAEEEGVLELFEAAKLSVEGLGEAGRDLDGVSSVRLDPE